MKKLLLLIVCCWWKAAISQCNLVPNPSFEIDTNCTSDGAGGILFGYAPPWTSPNYGTTYLFNSCYPFNSCTNVPISCYGYQLAHSGNGYCDIVTFDPSAPNFRQYIQVHLDSALLANGVYCVSFYVNLADSVGIATNNIGMYFSDTATFVNNGSQYLHYTPQIIYTNVITDTSNWTEISGTFMAHGGERYIIIGNFYPDSGTDTSAIQTPWTWHQRFGIYYVDDVDVHRCTCNVGVSELSKTDNLQLIPNPATNEVTITTNTKQKSIHIYNMLGSEVYQQPTTNNQQLTIDISGFAKGIYFVEVKTDNGILRKKLMKE